LVSNNSADQTPSEEDPVDLNVAALVAAGIRETLDLPLDSGSRIRRVRSDMEANADR
jgi:hypothetical protein